MKIANTLLIGALSISILSEALLIYGYKEAYLEQLTQKSVVKHTLFRNLRSEGNIKAIKVTGIKFRLHLGAEKQGFQNDYRRVGFSYSKRGDTLNISATSDRYDGIDFCDLYFPQLTHIYLDNCFVTFVGHKKTDFKAVVSQNSVMVVEKGKIEKLKLSVLDSSRVELGERVEIDKLETTLSNKSIFKDNRLKGSHL